MPRFPNGLILQQETNITQCCNVNNTSNKLNSVWKNILTNILCRWIPTWRLAFQKEFAPFTGKHLRWNSFIVQLTRKRISLESLPCKFYKNFQVSFSQRALTENCFWNLFRTQNDPMTFYITVIKQRYQLNLELSLKAQSFKVENTFTKTGQGLSEIQLIKTNLNSFNHGFPFHSILTCLVADIVFANFNPFILRN